MPKVVILGWYGNGNLGDEMILECMIAELKSLSNSLSFTVMSSSPAMTAKIHSVRSIRRHGGVSVRLQRFKEIVGADLFVLGGGGILTTYGSSELSVLEWLGPLNLAHELGIPTMTYGVGVEDQWSDSGKKAMSRVLGETDMVCVRDQRSIDNLTQIGVQSGVVLAADPAILLPDFCSYHNSPRSKDSPPLVLVFLRHWFVRQDRTYDEAKWAEFKIQLAGCLDSLVSGRSALVRFVPMRTSDPVDDDTRVATEVLGLMKNGAAVEVLDHVPSPSELLDMVVGSDLVIGMRLHSLIAAVSLGIPAIAINYHPKVRSFMESLQAADWVLEIGETTREKATDMAFRALDGHYPRELILREAERMKGLAHMNAEIAIKLLGAAKARRRHRSLSAFRVIVSRVASPSREINTGR